MLAAFRIVLDVVVYRLRRLEMANLVAAVAIMIALGTRPLDLVIRTAFGAGLNVLAYLTNDYCDVEQDLAEGRGPAKYLSEHLGAALGAQIGIALILAGVAAWYDIGLLVPLGLGAGICWAYSARLKARPVVDILSMVLWGVAMPLVAFPLGNKLGWLLVIQLGLFSACFETIQVLRDRDEDVRANVRTTAVAFGAERTRLLARVFMLVAMTYALLVLDRCVGLLLVVPVFVPIPRAFDAAAMSQYWNRIRLTQGLSWLGLLAGVYFRGSTHGWLLSGVG
ncbi:MAG: UbiA family prenyltransferase [Myxococcales bacterium]|nr:UbiA family prenyltransferase [Myxococcales bacterium]